MSHRSVKPDRSTTAIVLLALAAALDGLLGGGPVRARADRWLLGVGLGGVVSDLGEGEVFEFGDELA
jgi:hypothetical protein